MSDQNWKMGKKNHELGKSVKKQFKIQSCERKDKEFILNYCIFRKLLKKYVKQ